MAPGLSERIIPCEKSTGCQCGKCNRGVTMEDKFKGITMFAEGLGFCVGNQSEPIPFKPYVHPNKGYYARTFGGKSKKI